MNLQSKGIIIGLRKFQEKKLIVSCFTEDFGIVSGISNINASRKSKSFLVPGDIGYISWHGRLEDHLGYIKVDHLNHITASLHNNRYRLTILESILTLIQTFLVERQESVSLFSMVHDTILYLISDNNDLDAIKKYCLFELELLNEIGFGLDLKKCVATGNSKDLTYVSPKSGCAVSLDAGHDYRSRLLILPEFLLNKDSKCIDKDIMNSINLTGYFLHKAASTVNKDKNLSIRNNIISNLPFGMHSNKSHST